MYHVYDGFIFPSEKWPWWNRISDLFSSTGLSTKESYQIALIIYLESVMLWTSLPLNHAIKYISSSVCKIYMDLKQRKFLQYEEINKFTQYNCVDQLNRALQKVCKLNCK